MLLIKTTRFITKRLKALSIMRVKKISVTDFKRFTNLTIEDIPSTAKLVVLVGPNGSGKSSLIEAMNHFYKTFAYMHTGEPNYLHKASKNNSLKPSEWNSYLSKTTPVKIEFHDSDPITTFGLHQELKGHFYFRSAYRNEPDFELYSMQRQDNPVETFRLETLIQNDQTVSNNYQRLVASTISNVYDTQNDSKTVEELRDELIGRIRAAISNVFEDLQLSSIGDPLQDGSFYFTKGNITNFHYRNLSAGEKSAFDLILDLVVQSKYYPNAVYCIDEPETHMHTQLQGKVLRELYNLIPGNSQLWISTHSIGMLQEASDIETDNPDTVVFLDFDNRNFDEEQTISPSPISRAVLTKFYELAFGDFAKLILPKKIVFCEGSSTGKSRKNYDQIIFSKIFSETHPDTFFISGGSCQEIEDIDSKFGDVLTQLFKNCEIIKIIDRDDRTNDEVNDLAEKGIKVTSKRHIESYLLDDEIIQKLCTHLNKNEEFEACLEAKTTALTNAENRGRPSDDIKSASGELYNALRQILKLTRCGHNVDGFMRDIMAPLITPDTRVYAELEKDIFS